MRPEIQFDPEKHEYRIGGLLIPNVTTILGNVGLGPDFSKVRPDELEFAAQRGRAVHAATALYDLDDLDEETMDERILPYLEGWRKFRAEKDFTPTEIERIVYSSKWGYVGTLDRVGEMKGYATLIDIKTGPVYLESVGPQTSAYDVAYREEFKQPPLKRFAVRLPGDGTYKLVPCTSKVDFDVFIHALSIMNWRNKTHVRG